MKRLLLLCIFIGWSSCTLLQPRKEMNVLTQNVLSVLAKHPEAQISVFYKDATRGHQLAIAADSVVHAASTMKIAVMLEVYRQVAEGRLQLADSLLLKNEFRSIVDASSFSISDDSDDFSYQKLGEKMSIRDLVVQMITVSSNLATNILLEKVGAQQVQHTISQFGTQKMQVLRGVEDLKAFEKGLNNRTSARDLGLLMHILALGKHFPPDLNTDMLEILKAQKFNEMIPATLPPHTPVAHKTGNITKHHHDAAIVYPDRKPPYVLVILIKGVADMDASAKIGVTISKTIYDWHMQR